MMHTITETYIYDLLQLTAFLMNEQNLRISAKIESEFFMVIIVKNYLLKYKLTIRTDILLFIHTAYNAKIYATKLHQFEF